MNEEAKRSLSDEAKEAQRLSKELDGWLDEEPEATASQPIWPQPAPGSWDVDTPEYVPLPEFERQPTGSAEAGKPTNQGTSKATHPEHARGPTTPPTSPRTK